LALEFLRFFLRCKFSVCRARNRSRAAGACACPLLLVSALRRYLGSPDTGGLAVFAVPPCRTSRGGFFVVSMRFQSFKERTRKNSGRVAAGSWYTLFACRFYTAFSCPVRFPLSPLSRGVVVVSQPLNNAQIYKKN